MAQAEEIRTETGPLDYDYTEKEVELCQENLQNHKACSPDKIKNEMLKYGGTRIVSFLVVGLLMAMDEELVNARWKPTFEGVLNDYMNRFQCHFKMVALGWRDFEAAMKDTSVDFIFVDSGGYTVFERNYGIKALATVVRFFSGRTYSKEGGVIFARNGSLLSQQATSLKELQNFSATHTNLKLCAVDNESFSGYDIQRYEFFKRGLRLEDIFHEIVFTEENDKIVELVMDGHCDVGEADR
eukprot:g10137.t1